MVDPAALALLDAAVAEADFVQLPVLPEPQRGSPWIGSHYCEEFAEAHGKTLVVREALSGSLPAAGVGCAFSRPILAAIAWHRGGTGPFSVESLTEDYEFGLKIKAAGGRSRLLRARGEDGQLVATRACFPARFGQAVRQKSRWVHGICLQGWDRLGWSGSPSEWWMLLRDRRGPLSALVLAVGYLVFCGGTLLFAAKTLGFGFAVPLDAWLVWLLGLNLVAFAWRAAMRFAFTTREYGWVEGLRTLGRIPIANFIAIGAGARALGAYARSLAGEAPRWDKTFHDAHPVALAARVTAA
jgi:adsorption protein B